MWVWYKTGYTQPIMVTDAYVETAWLVVLAAVNLGLPTIEVYANVVGAAYLAKDEPAPD